MENDYLPEFFIDAVGQTEQIGNGLVRMQFGNNRSGRFVPLYWVIMSGEFAILGGRSVSDAGNDAFNHMRLQGENATH